ncbi:MAG: YicC/YloC family endoribonuclease [bacterium]
MIRSMTGYGSAEVERAGQRVTAEIRSVNHRFCEVSLRGPKVALLFEEQIRRVVQDRYSRGKFNLTISWSGAGERGEVLKLNDAVARRYVDLMSDLKARYNLSGDVDLATVAGLPDLFTWEHTAMSDEESWTILEQVVARACDNMTLMTDREGQALARDFEHRLRVIRTELDRVVERAPLRPLEAKERLVARIKPLLGDLEMDPVRIAQEVALLADRLDCTEECVRLSAHLEQFQHLIEGPELAGRKLNFLLQEMNREANTIGSKANDVEIGRAVIVMKEEIERIREQVQNAE